MQQQHIRLNDSGSVLRPSPSPLIPFLLSFTCYLWARNSLSLNSSGLGSFPGHQPYLLASALSEHPVLGDKQGGDASVSTRSCVCVCVCMGLLSSIQGHRRHRVCLLRVLDVGCLCQAHFQAGPGSKPRQRSPTGPWGHISAQVIMSIKRQWASYTQV